MSYCKHAGKFEVVRTKIADGSWQARMCCTDCEKLYGNAIPQEELDMDALYEYQRQSFNPPCARCGNQDTQIHHYFPKAMARKAKVNPDDWPTEYLCSRCQTLWHQFVTPGLVGRITNGERRTWEAPKQ